MSTWPEPKPRELSTWSVLRRRLEAQGDHDLIARLATEADAYRCPKCQHPDPIVALTTRDDLVMVCAQCNRAALELQGYEVPK